MVLLDTKSNTEKYMAFPSLSNTSPITGIGYLSFTVFSFNFLKSTTNHHFCFPEWSIFFGTSQTGSLQG